MSRWAEAAEGPDAALMSRLADGDHEAMNVLVHRFGPGLHRLIGRLACGSAETDDILQEVFLTAWRKAGTFHGGGSLEGWMRRLAVNRCRNHHRARAAFERLLRRAADRWRLTAANPAKPDSGLCDRLNGALVQLRADDRAVLVLFYLEELSSEQVAQTLGVTVETLHVRLHRARNRLRELLEKQKQTDEEF